MRLKPILTILVLYKMSLTESPTFRAIRRSMQEEPRISDAIDLVVADNSPQAGSGSPGFKGIYLHDGKNPGLAARYNQALQMAVANGNEWLLLFDQDTTPTAEYFAELTGLTASLSDEPKIAAIVPKLRMNGRIMSPHEPLYQDSKLKVEASSSGVLDDSLRAFNSGALIRVSALQAIGGFPLDYWLDYLDHATFHRIQQNGGRVYVMRTILEHELSEATPNRKVDPVRLANRLAAEERFHSEFGTRSERIRHRFDLLRQVIGHGRRGRFRHALVRLRVLLHID